MGVDPKYQKTGGGMALLKWAIETSDSSGLPIYFESSPTTVKLYERVGFERLKEKIVHKAADLQLDHDIEVPLMVRMPKRAQEKGITFEVWREQGYPDL
jgi:N-acetylglutamate synthase-like GNAT family acetyltransferase